MNGDQRISVKDQDSFSARYLPDLNQDIEASRAYTWRITNWKGLEDRLTSPDFECGGHKWHFLLFPFGNTRPEFQPIQDYVSIYVDCQPLSDDDDWHACAQFSLVLSNPNDPNNYVESHAHHRFIPDEPDWGFTRFIQLRELYSIQEGKTRPVVEDDSADLTVYLRVMKDPTGDLWDNLVKPSPKALWRRRPFSKSKWKRLIPKPCF